MCSYPRPPATIITVSGEIDPANAEYVSDYIVGFVHVDHPLVLDLSGVAFLGPAGLRAVVRFAAACRRAERHWALVSSDAVNVALRVYGEGERLPVAEALGAALQRLATLPDSEWRAHCITSPARMRC